jgi:hypothetical protein
MQNHSRMKSVCRLIVTVALVGCLVGSTSVQAQDVAVGQATATVLTMLTVTATMPLKFGDVMQGVRKVVAKSVDDAGGVSSGIFTIAGAVSKEVSCYLQLPDYLWNSTNEDRLVIAFSATDALIDTTAAGTPGTPGAGLGATDQDPHNLPEFALNDVGGLGKIYLGGTVWPTVDQRNDAYSADIILTVAYTGN